LDIQDAQKKAEETGADGVMLGRAIFGNPFLFAPQKGDVGFKMYDVRKKLQVMLEHTKLFDKLLGGVKNFAIMRKHYKAYVQGFGGSKELRMKLMETKAVEEVEKIVQEALL
ncbi:MAG: tRNA-dihydrouridine synthase, partial [Candidatus Taylorbacteria bacterium]|nr:tRNA-dihydrouridine synthase [Candidatus Taylorbacteria bacterium]